MHADHFANRAQILDALEIAKSHFSVTEYQQLVQAAEKLSRHALVTLKEIAPGATPDAAWVPITDIVDGDDRPDDMTAVSTAANELQEFGLIEAEPPAADDGARIDVLRFRATDLGRRFASAALVD